jgi:hypothetical protein
MSEDVAVTQTADQTVDDEHVLDEEWLAAPRRRSRLRFLLAATLAAALCFLGGALVQKHFGTVESTTVSGLPSGVPNGFPGTDDGEFPGGGQPSANSGAPATAPGTGDDGTGAVIGTVVEIDRNVWVVEDLGGERHEVRVGDQAHIVRETELTADQVAVGDRVDVTGTTLDNELVADDVTLR